MERLRGERGAEGQHRDEDGTQAEGITEIERMSECVPELAVSKSNECFTREGMQELLCALQRSESPQMRRAQIIRQPEGQRK